MTTNDGCRADVRKARAEAAGVDDFEYTLTRRALRQIKAEAWDEGKWATYSAEREGRDGSELINPYRADRLATDTAAPEGTWMDERYAKNLIEFVRTFETGEHAANALPIFLRSAMRPAAPVAVEGVETVETLAEVLAAWDFEHSKKPLKVYVDNKWRYQCQCGETFLTMQEFYGHRIDSGAARIVQARAGEGALRDRIEALRADCTKTVALNALDAWDRGWRQAHRKFEHLLRAALATADPS